MFRKGTLPSVIIIGAGFAGLTAAQKLKKHKLNIILIDKHNHHAFQPFLYQVACGDLSPSDISIPIRSEFENRSNIQVLMDTVTAIDKNSKLVMTKTLTLSYDYLVIATGSTENFFGHEAWGKHCYRLKSINDALNIQQQLLTLLEKEELKQSLGQGKDKSPLTISIIGGGPTGVELAGSLAELRNFSVKKDFRYIDPSCLRILLIEASSRLLSGFDEALSGYSFNALTEQKVTILLNTTVKNIQEKLIDIGQECIHSEMIIWAAGVKAKTINQWKNLGVVTGKGERIKVNLDLSIPNAPNIFALGDIAEVTSQEGPVLPALAAVATQQGAFVAKVIIDRINKKSKPLKFVYRNLGAMAVVRKYNAIAQFDHFIFKGTLAWLLWWLAHLYFLIGFRNRLVVLINWLWSLVTLKKSNRLIINDLPQE